MYKNILFLSIGALYFTLYFSPEYHGYFNSISNFPFGGIIISYLNGFIAFFITVGVISTANQILRHIDFKKHISTTSIITFMEYLIRFISITKYIAASYVFVQFIDLPKQIDFILKELFSIPFLIIFLFFLTGFVNKLFQDDLIAKSKLKTVSKTLLPFINKVIVVFIWIIGAITILGNLGYNVSALVAGAGIGGLAIAFAAQKSIANVFGAITIILNKPFKIGDYIRVNDITGTVKDIGLSYLTVTDMLGHQVMIPNEAIISSNVENFTVRKNRRTDATIGLIYGTTQEQMTQAVGLIETILEEYKQKEEISSYRVNFDMFADFSLNINVTYFSLLNSEYKKYLEQKQSINLQIKEQFKNNNLEMAFPTQELIIKK